MVRCTNGKRGGICHYKSTKFFSKQQISAQVKIMNINVIGKLQLQFVTEQNHFLREVLITLKIFAELLKPLSKVLLYPL